MNMLNMWWERSEIDTPECHAPCSWRQPAYSGSMTSGSHGWAFGFHSSATGDPARSMPSWRVGAAMAFPLLLTPWLLTLR